MGLVVLSANAECPPEQLTKDLIALMRQKIGPVAAFKLVAVVERLPKTRSGKILRGTMKKIADGSEWKMPATIDDPTALDDIITSILSMGYPKHKTLTE